MSADQRFIGILDTSPFRLAIVYSIVFACGAAALLGAVDFAVSRVVDGSTDNLIEAEVQGLRGAPGSRPPPHPTRLTRNTQTGS